MNLRALLVDKSNTSPPPSIIPQFHHVLLVWCLIKFLNIFVFNFTVSEGWLID
jgi:hypothetical protein